MEALLTTSFGINMGESTIDDLSDTPTLKTALAGPEKDQWVAAIRTELDNIRAEDIYDLVNPANENVDNLLGNKIVLRRKRGATSNIERYKA